MRIKGFKSSSSPYVFMLPYILLFMVFIVAPVAYAIYLSFTFFNAVETPSFIGLQNYVYLFTQDNIFMQYVLPNTIRFALIVGPGGYILSFIVAWMLAQIQKVPRTIFALIMFSPSMTAGIAMASLWTVLFSGDPNGYLNALLLRFNLISTPIQFLQSADHLMTIVILVTLWGSMGVGFLAMLSGIMNVNQELYEAGYIDGIKNRFQEVIYITIPSMKPQMLFGAVMAIVNTFQAGAIGVALSGQNPTPQYSAQLIVNHIEEFGIIRYEMGYAAAIAVMLLLMIYGFSKFSRALFAEKD